MAAMSTDLVIEPTTAAHIAELAAVLHDERVYQHIGGLPPLQEIERWLAGAITGPPPSRATEQWLNFAVRHARSGEMLGRLEATVVGANAEVAFVFGPAHWGTGYATKGLQWLHEHLRRHWAPEAFWATTVPANLRCQALLLRSGYEPFDPVAAPALTSYDPGDMVFKSHQLM